MSTPTAEELKREAWESSSNLQMQVAQLAQRLATALAEVERLRAAGYDTTREEYREERNELRAEVERLRMRLVAACPSFPADTDLETALRGVEKRSNAFDREYNLARELRQRAEAAEADVIKWRGAWEIENSLRMGAEAKLAEAQQREACWREYAAMKPLGYLAPLEQARRDELRRLLGLEDQSK